MKMQGESRHSQKAAPGFLFWLWAVKQAVKKTGQYSIKTVWQKRNRRGKSYRITLAKNAGGRYDLIVSILNKKEKEGLL